MHFNRFIGALVLAGGAIAAPADAAAASASASDSTVLQVPSNSTTPSLSDLSATLSTDAATRKGPTKNFKDECPFSVSPVTLNPARYAPVIQWAQGYQRNKWIDWKTFKANGANLGGWLAKEKTHDPIWWSKTGAPDTPDEWNLCGALGQKQCGQLLEKRFATFLNITTIDKLASVGVNTLRIPTTYAAWVKVPGSQLYSGTQKVWLRLITEYAINRYNMHIIIGLHSLPGGVNSLDIGEGFGHSDWFQNATNLKYSLTAIDGVLDFIKASSKMQAFTVSPINEASDTHLQGFGSPAGLTDAGADWINTYLNAVLARIKKVDSRIPMMIQDCFKGASFWSPFYDASENIVLSSHVYYFAAAGVYANYVSPAICGQAQYLATETKFPVFVGEWSLQTRFNNTLAGRKTIFDTQRYAFNKYTAGSCFWTGVSEANTPVDGEGNQRDYWSYVDLINQGVITKQTTQSYCE